MYGEQIVAMASGKPVPPTTRLNVQAQRGACDRDRITLAQATVENVKRKMERQTQPKKVSRRGSLAYVGIGHVNTKSMLVNMNSGCSEMSP